MWNTFIMIGNDDAAREVRLQTREDPFGPKVNGVLTFIPEMQRKLDRLYRFMNARGLTIHNWETYPPEA